MFPKRMKSKEHGFLHVYDIGQEQQVRAHGWVEESEHLPGSKESLDAQRREEMERLFSEYEAELPQTWIDTPPNPVKRRVTRKIKS